MKKALIYTEIYIDYGYSLKNLAHIKKYEMVTVADSAIMARSEASGLLMSVIRTLHETDTGQEREEEKRKLEAEFKQCDHALDKMVASHQGELSSVMATYSTVSWSFFLSDCFC